MIEFETRLTPADYVRLMVLGQLLTPLFVATLGLLALVTALALFLNGSRALPLLLVWGLIAALIGVFVAIIVYRAYSSGSRGVFLPTRMRIDEGGISHANADSDGRVAWSAFTRWRRAAGFYMLYLSAQSFVPVRQDALSPAERERLETLLRAHVRKGPQV